MQILTLFLAFAALCCHVAANKQSIGYEIVAYYYIYKIEYMSGIAPEDRRMGVECQKKNKMCNFAEFAGPLLSKRDKGQIDARYRGSDQKMPDKEDANFISRIVKPSQLVRANELCKGLPSGNTPYAKVIEHVTSVMDDAAIAGGADKEDFAKADTFATEARAVRKRASYKSVTAALKAQMQAEGRYLVVDNKKKEIDWTKTLENIRNAESKGELTADRAEELRELSANAMDSIIPTKDPQNESHWAIIRAYTTLSTKARDIVERMGSGATSVPATGGGACGSEFI